jgi:hypothetical protein
LAAVMLVRGAGRRRAWSVNTARGARVERPSRDAPGHLAAGRGGVC